MTTHKIPLFKQSKAEQIRTKKLFSNSAPMFSHCFIIFLFY
jgi:hypothetical protein